MDETTGGGAAASTAPPAQQGAWAQWCSWDTGAGELRSVPAVTTDVPIEVTTEVPTEVATVEATEQKSAGRV